MLVLSRKRDEEIVITTPAGEQITITVVEIRTDQVRIGFTAADTVTIMRKELLEGKEAPHGLERPTSRRPLYPE